jgi:hypothetical protein
MPMIVTSAIQAIATAIPQAHQPISIHQLSRTSRFGPLWWKITVWPIERPPGGCATRSALRPCRPALSRSRLEGELLIRATGRAFRLHNKDEEQARPDFIEQAGGHRWAIQAVRRHVRDQHGDLHVGFPIG